MTLLAYPRPIQQVSVTRLVVGGGEVSGPVMSVLLQNFSDVGSVVGMDIDKGLLKERARFLPPLTEDCLCKRKEED